MSYDFIARFRDARIVDVRSATQVKAFVPFTALPQRMAGKTVALLELDESEIETIAAIKAAVKAHESSGVADARPPEKSDEVGVTEIPLWEETPETQALTDRPSTWSRDMPEKVPSTSA